MTSPKKDKTKEEKRKIIVLLIGIGSIVFFLIWRFALSVPGGEEVVIMPVQKSVPPIDFKYLEDPVFNSFIEYETIPAIDKELLGRENPFNPY